MQKLTLLSSPGRYEGSQSDCILLATNGDIQAINAGSPNVHINLHTVQKVDGGKGKWLKETMPNKKYIICLHVTPPPKREYVTRLFTSFFVHDLNPSMVL